MQAMIHHNRNKSLTRSNSGAQALCDPVNEGSCLAQEFRETLTIPPGQAEVGMYDKIWGADPALRRQCHEHRLVRCQRLVRGLSMVKLCRQERMPRPRPLNLGRFPLPRGQIDPVIDNLDDLEMLDNV